MQTCVAAAKQASQRAEAERKRLQLAAGLAEDTEKALRQRLEQKDATTAVVLAEAAAKVCFSVIDIATLCEFCRMLVSGAVLFCRSARPRKSRWRSASSGCNTRQSAEKLRPRSRCVEFTVMHHQIIQVMMGINAQCMQNSNGFHCFRHQPEIQIQGPSNSRMCLVCLDRCCAHSWL